MKTGRGGAGRDGGEAAPGAAGRILALIACIPPGRLMTYGDVAEHLGLGSPRQVGRALADVRGGVPWHRVVHSDGTMAERVRDRQRQLLLSEGVGVRGRRVDLQAHRWSGRDPRPPPRATRSLDGA
ncbi:MAG: MGMT family protein [Candidatus Dormibacteraeota bacterium]|nr:MGMT family protein [Candidatus Dormibacteraeota bacterium]